MPRIEQPGSPIVSKLEGVHLFHFDGAPCAQRVRFALAEKGFKRGREVRFDAADDAACAGQAGAWVSRIVSLIRKDHMSEAYARIQPNMVVPALVHDGVLYIESMDIIEYLDDAFGGDPLVPREADRAADARQLVEQGKQLHVSIRYVTFRWGLGRLGQLNEKEEARLRELAANGNDEEGLVGFYEKYDRGSIDDAAYRHHLSALAQAFNALEQRLADGRPFLVGPSLSTADVIFAMKVMRLHECGYPFAERYPALFEWYERIYRRPSYQAGVMSKHRAMHRAFRAKARIENLLGVGLHSAMRRLAAG